MKLTVAQEIGYLTIAIGCATLLIWVSFFRLPSTYSATPINGQVVDADTGQPLEGAIVIAIWELERGFGLEGSINSGYMHVAEVLTDNNGNFHIDGWGPSKRPGGRYLGHNAPRLIVFKEDYGFFSRGNSYDSIFIDKRRAKVHHSSWDGEVIKLTSHVGDLKNFADSFWQITMSMTTLLDPVFGAKTCDWLKIPKMIKTFNNYDQLFTENGIRAGLIPDIKNLNYDNHCGSDTDINNILQR